jgi:pimeloyl-ACP methyl ester carboxylesterase
MLGFSMGGAVTIGSLERFPQHYAGGVSLCGANLSGEQIATDLLTTLVAFDYFFPKADGLPAAGLVSREAAALPQGELYQGIANALQRDPSHAAVLARRLQVSLMHWPARSACTRWSCTNWPRAAACRSATWGWCTADSVTTPHSMPACSASIPCLRHRRMSATRWQ